MQTKAFIDHGGFPWRAAINWSCSSLWTPAVGYIVNWWPLPAIWIYSHPTASCLSLWLLPDLQTICQGASWVIWLVAGLAVSRWTNWCLHSYGVAGSDVFDVATANRLDLDLLWPGWDGCVSRICWCGIGEVGDNEKQWEFLRTI